MGQDLSDTCSLWVFSPPESVNDKPQWSSSACEPAHVLNDILEKKNLTTLVLVLGSYYSYSKPTLLSNEDMHGTFPCP